MRQTKAAGASSGLLPCTIIVVEEEDTSLRKTLELIAQTGPCAVQCVVSAHEAVDILERTRVAAVFAPLRLSHGSVGDLLDTVRRLSPSTTRVVVGELQDRDLGIELLADGLAHHYLLKPLSGDESLMFLRQVVWLGEDDARQEIKQYLRSLSSLPSPPKFQERVYRILEDPKSSLIDLAREIEQNPPLVAKVLQVANSVHFGSLNRISTIRDALIFIGMEHIGQLLVSVEVFQNFMNNTDLAVRFRVGQLWEEALLRAPIARAIAQQWEGNSSDPHSAYIASLLQDVGMLVRLCSDPENYERVVELWKTGTCSLYDADRRVFGVSHDIVGATLLELWNFPDEISRAVSGHHASAHNNQLATILQIADALTTSDPSSPHDPHIDPLLDDWRNRLHIDATSPGPPGLNAH